MLSVESIYIHIPFCKTKCPYCDFASWANKENLIEGYFQALYSEINLKCTAYIDFLKSASKDTRISNIKTIYIGGGTPSLIHPHYYSRLFEEIKKYFALDKNCEITMEANPGTVTEDYMKSYKNLGVNRISIGAQSFNEDILKTLGRKHSVEETIDAINIVKSAGILNFNLDLIFSVPGMTRTCWSETINKALEHGPKHISSYSLIIEPNTPFETIYKNPKTLPGGDFAFELYSDLCQILNNHRFRHYEISNFAKYGYESSHNLTYWLHREYFAFGNGAHRFLNGLRTQNLRNLEDYIENPLQEIITEYPTDYNFEKMMLLSRLDNGFDIGLLRNISQKSEDYIENILSEMSKEGFLELSKGRVSLTEKGMFLNNEILLKLL